VKRKLAILIATLVVLANLAPAHVTFAQGAGFVIDPAAMALNSLDLRSNGLPNFGIDHGQYLTGGEVAAWSESQLGGAVTQVAGWGYLDGYTVSLSQRVTFGIPEVVATAWFTSTVLRFDNNGGASAVFWDLVEATANRDVDVLRHPTAEGREFWAGRMEFPTGERSEMQTGVVAIAHTGTDIGIVMLAPAQEFEEIGPLSDRLSEKITILHAKSGPDIGIRTVRVAGEAVSTANAIYFMSYGAPVQLTSQTAAAFAQVPEMYPAVVDGFRSSQIVPQPGGGHWTIQVISLAFPDAGSASSWLNGAGDRVAGAELLPDAARFGDTSITLTFTNEQGEQVRQITLQAGAEVAAIEIRGQALVDPAALEALATQQVNCFAGNCGALPVPVALAGPAPVSTPAVIPPTATPAEEIASPGSVATPDVAAATPEPESTAPDEPLVRDDALGFQIAYDDTVWALVTSEPASDKEGQANYEFTNGVTAVTITANGSPGGDVQACFDQTRDAISGSEGVENFAEGRNAQGEPIFSRSDDVSQGVFTYSNPDGEVMAVFIYCTLPESRDGSLTITFVATIPAAQFNEQNTLVPDLVRGISVDAW